MIKTQSDDPNVSAAAHEALTIITSTLDTLPVAQVFDYGGHQMHVGEYDVCERCTIPIAEAQQAEQTIRIEMELIDDQTVREHLELVARLFHAEAEAAILRAELHNGQGSEQILNRLLGYNYDRQIGDEYQHSHHGGII